MERSGETETKSTLTSGSERYGDGIDISPLHQRIMDIARYLMQRHYLLDLDKLNQECVRSLKDASRQQIQHGVDDLIRRRILIHGKSLNRQQLLDNPNRERILAMIKREPGIHFSRIKAELNRESRTVQWHLEMLKKFDFIREERFGNNVVYFDFLLEKNHDRLHYYLHKDGASAILKEIMAKPGISTVDLMSTLGMPRSTLARKLNVLVEEGFVNIIHPSSQTMSYVIMADVKPVLRAYLARTTTT